MAEKDKSAQQTEAPAPTSASAPAGGAGIPASAFDADLAAADQATKDQEKRAERYELPQEAIDAREESSSEMVAEQDKARDEAEAANGDEDEDEVTKHPAKTAPKEGSGKGY